MQAEEFLKKVRVRAGLDNNDQAKRVTEAVLETLRARISHAGGDNVASQLPKELKEMWESGTLEHLKRSLVGVERMDLGEFLARVANQANLQNMQESEVATRAVFQTMREQITPGADHSVQSQLPNDIREFWLNSTPEEQPKEQQEAQAQTETTVGEVRVSHERPTDWMVVEEEEEEYQYIEPGVPRTTEAEMIEAQTEAQVREMGRQGVEPIRGEEEEPHVAPPAEERIEKVAPSEKRKAVEGPGSEVYYRSDVELTQEIRQMLDSTDELDAGNVDVFVQAGNVDLRGSVKSEHEKDVAGKIAAKALGVGDIRNEISVEKQ